MTRLTILIRTINICVFCQFCHVYYFTDRRFVIRITVPMRYNSICIQRKHSICTNKFSIYNTMISRMDLFLQHYNVLPLFNALFLALFIHPLSSLIVIFLLSFLLFIKMLYILGLIKFIQFYSFLFYDTIKN